MTVFRGRDARITQGILRKHRHSKPHRLMRRTLTVEFLNYPGVRYVVS
jgi:hypothetical protein